jgi:hypothetical protein
MLGVAEDERGWTVVAALHMARPTWRVFYLPQKLIPLVFFGLHTNGSLGEQDDDG